MRQLTASEARKPQDSDIIAELQGASKYGEPTYVLKNCLRMKGFDINTTQLRKRLKYLEEKGVVKRCKSPYFHNNICWGLV